MFMSEDVTQSSGRSNSFDIESTLEDSRPDFEDARLTFGNTGRRSFEDVEPPFQDARPTFSWSVRNTPNNPVYPRRPVGSTPVGNQSRAFDSGTNDREHDTRFCLQLSDEPIPRDTAVESRRFVSRRRVDAARSTGRYVLNPPPTFDRIQTAPLQAEEVEIHPESRFQMRQRFGTEDRQNVIQRQRSPTPPLAPPQNRIRSRIGSALQFANQAGDSENRAEQSESGAEQSENSTTSVEPTPPEGLRPNQFRRSPTTRRAWLRNGLQPAQRPSFSDFVAFPDAEDRSAFPVMRDERPSFDTIRAHDARTVGHDEDFYFDPPAYRPTFYYTGERRTFADDTLYQRGERRIFMDRPSFEQLPFGQRHSFETDSEYRPSFEMIDDLHPDHHVAQPRVRIQGRPSFGELIIQGRPSFEGTRGIDPSIGDRDWIALQAMFLAEEEEMRNAVNEAAAQNLLKVLPEWILESPLPQPCSICLGTMCEGERVQRLPCCHAFHSECIASWLKKKQTCPLDNLCVQKMIRHNCKASEPTCEPCAP
eukprot:gnl/MRDRNA2_/MRDRNA2_28612_c0_seq1.p1 gnl/MRDRNA2_/MRDRNA2_28612_c0~~gnl/MRDRNA2_/MRDRNA2_28612_c0_seq1.p1  ORF type:complete len:534 (-),score=49.78 gnl/MRDRNA2_/MRDRNA2_28612_c0_seq1:22-1623(-)